MEIQFTTQIFKEGRTFVAYTRELDLSSCGGTRQKALQNLKEAVRLFLEEAGKMGTLQQILEEDELSNKCQKGFFLRTERFRFGAAVRRVLRRLHAIIVDR